MTITQTLIFNGSPKENGDTAFLVNELASNLIGEVKIITHKDNISSCVDCRYCWKNVGCAIKDAMQALYPFIESCDNIIIASPIWFSSLSGILLNMASRVQTLYAAEYFRKDKIPMKQKKGVIIIVGAEPGTEVVPTQNAMTIMKFMNVHRPSITKIYSLDTNNVPTHEDKTAMIKCREAAEMLNKNFE